MKPETSERLRELADRATDPGPFVTEYDSAWTMEECAEIAKSLQEMLDERRGAEAEELRTGLELILADAPGGDLESNNEWTAAIGRLLDEVDARDSLAHLEQRELTKKRRREAIERVLRLSPDIMLEDEEREGLRDSLLAALETMPIRLTPNG